MKYHPNDTAIHRLDPRVKIIMLITLTILVFLSRNVLVLGVIFVAIISAWIVSKTPVNELVGYMKLLVGLVLFLFVIQAIFQNGETALIDPIIPYAVPLIGGIGRITLEGILYGLLLSFRLVIILCLMPLVIMTMRTKDFSLGFVKLGVPYRIAYMITMALNYVPTLQGEISTITSAQKLRGFMVFEKGSALQKLKAYPALVIPLVMGAMKRSMQIGMAMDVKAFGLNKKRTFLHDLTMRKADWAVLFLFCALYAALLAMNYLL